MSDSNSMSFGDYSMIYAFSIDSSLILPSCDRTRESIPIFRSHAKNSILESLFFSFRIPFISNEISGVLPESLVDDVPPDHTRK